MAQMNMAALLVSDDVAESLEGSEDFSSGEDRELTHTATSTWVSFTAPFENSGSPSAANALTWSRIASLIFRTASRSVLPCEMQPGKDGHVTTYTPSSSRSRRTRISITVPPSFTNRAYHASCTRVNRQTTEHSGTITVDSTPALGTEHGKNRDGSIFLASAPSQKQNRPEFSRDIITEHRGEITVESTPGFGTETEHVRPHMFFKGNMFGSVVR